MTNEIVPSLGDVVAEMEKMYDPAWARTWDSVGLVAGELGATVRRVLFAVDVTESVVDEAIAWRADLIVAHHPLLFRPVSTIASTTPNGRLLHQLIRANCGLYTAHTNADAAVPGVSDALARILGLTDLEPLQVEPGDEKGRGTGRIGRLEKPVTLREFAMVVAEALPATAQGIRVSGDPNGEVQRIAVCGGSGDSLLDIVRDSGVDAYVTADLRHHPAGDARAHAGQGTPYLIDVAHWASEWPWLAGASNKLAGVFEGMGQTLEVRVSEQNTDPWDFRVPSAGTLVR